MTKKPIIFIETSGYFYSNPTLDYCLQYLERTDRKVFFIGPKSCKNKNVIDICILPKIFFKINLLLIQIIGINFLGLYLTRVIKKKTPLSSELWIVDPDGLLVVPHSVLQNLNCWYFSYEMWFQAEIGTSLTRRISKKISHVDNIISTDVVRERLLVDEYSLGNKRKFCWPVFAPIETKDVELSKFDGLYRNLKDYKILVFIGSIENWTMADEIFDSMRKLPDNYRLLINSRVKSKLINKRIPQDVRDKVIINTVSLNTFEEVIAFLKLADIGLAFYKPTYSNRVLGKNIEVMGYSSGKISTYLQAGLPVITNVSGEFQDHLRCYKSGVYVDTPADIYIGVKEIESSQQVYNNGAKFHFESIYQIPEWAVEQLL